MSMGFTLPRRSAVFIADAQGLDFLNSARASSDGPIDWLQNGEALLRWLEQSAIEPPESIQWLQAHWSAAELDAIAGQARELRAWFGGFVRAHMGRSLDGSELKELTRLNHLLERQQKYVQIAAPRNGGADLEIRTLWRWQCPQSVLLPIAEALARVICEEDFRHIRLCEAPSCGLLFVDRTRGLNRRWCSMSTCGNRSKQATRRNRLKRKPQLERRQ
jgi:predicted RNA-binding Zn ribbon-like protein